MLAPRHHGAMRHVGPARGELGTRTIFNLLGPLANPAGIKRQVIGVFDRKWVRPLAEVLKKLGAEHVWVVHGVDGLDELTTTGATYVCELKGGNIREFEVTPEEAGLPRATAAGLKGGDTAYNALALTGLLKGKKGPYRDIVLLNAGAGFVVAGRAVSLSEGVKMAANTVDSGAALTTLDRWAALTHESDAHESDAHESKAHE
jgi:anthranilate phosphoribosyltransferase